MKNVEWIDVHRQLEQNFTTIFVFVFELNFLIQYSLTDKFTLHINELCQLKGGVAQLDRCNDQATIGRSGVRIVVVTRLLSPLSTPAPFPCLPGFISWGKTAGGKINTPTISVMKIMSEAIPLLFLRDVNRRKLHFLHKTCFETLIYLHCNKEVEAFIPKVNGFIAWFEEQSYDVQF
jgi:hypothetical protein